MSVAFHERRRYLAYWRGMVEALSAALTDPRLSHGLTGLRSDGVASKAWVFPTADKGEVAVFAVLSAMAFAYGRQETVAARTRFAIDAQVWVDRGLEILNQIEGAPARPFRADIDG